MAVDRRAAVRVLTALVIGSVVLVGCGKETPVQSLQQVAKRDAEASLLAHATATAEAIGAPLTKWSTVSAPCDGPNGRIATEGQWRLTGTAQLAVPAEQQVPVLERLRDRWSGDGVEVREFRVLGDGQRATLSVRDPRSGVTTSLTSTVPAPPTAVALVTVTPCYAPVDGEDPARD